MGWAFAVLGTAWLTWHMAHPPPNPRVDPLPVPLPRPPSAEELARVQALGDRLAREIRAASTLRGEPLPVSELEAMRPDGTPWLPSGLPDNPLTASVAWVWEGCPSDPHPVPPPDWEVCPQTQTLRAGGLENSPEWQLREAPTNPDRGVTPQGNGNP